jgi:hypothetical protein
MVNRRSAGAVALGLCALLGFWAASNAGAADKPAGAKPKVVDACSLLTADEIAATVGTKVGPGDRTDDGLGDDGGYSSTCMWRIPRKPDTDISAQPGPGSYAILNVRSWPAGSKGAKAYLADFYHAAETNLIDSKPVPVKVGEDGLWWGDGVAVRKGKVSFGVSVHFVNGRPLERGMEEDLAKKIAAKL